MSASSIEPCRILDWDSRFFGINVASVLDNTLTDAGLAKVEAFCAAHAIDCLYFRARPDDAATVRIAEAHAFHLVDVRMILERPAAGSDLRPEGHSVAVRTVTSEDLPRLRQIARVSHTDTRFYTDPRFPRDLCDKLYETWISNAMNGSSLAVLVAEAAGDVAGYVTCDRDGFIGLIAVDASHRGRGVGTLLVQAAMKWFAQTNVTTVSVVTQGRNLAAQRLYGRCGFIARDLQLYYHRWFTRGG